MRVPVPTNRIVALAVAGALLTTVVAGALALPGAGTGGDGGAGPAGGTVAADAPTPNQNFTPAVRTASGYEEDGHEEDEREEEEHEEGHEKGEQEDHREAEREDEREDDEG